MYMYRFKLIQAGTSPTINILIHSTAYYIIGDVKLRNNVCSVRHVSNNDKLNGQLLIMIFVLKKNLFFQGISYSANAYLIYGHTKVR